MKWMIGLMALACFALGSLLTSSATVAEPEPQMSGPVFTTRLSGANEVPPIQSATRGRARVQFNSDRTRARFQLWIFNGERITQAHVHFGEEGTNGPVLLFLAGFHDRGWDVNGRFVEAIVTADNIIDTSAGTTLAEVADAMARGETYINVHSVANPPGEVRGQLR